MLVFKKENQELLKEDLDNTDALTLESYREVLNKHASVVFCMLVCENARMVYLARDIVEMRYGVNGKINVYLLKDPLTRDLVEDIWYFEVVENPLFRGKNLLKEDALLSAEAKFKVENTRVTAVYIGNELDLLFSFELQNKILSNILDNNSLFSATILAMFIIIIVTVGFYCVFSFFSFLFKM